MATKVMKLWIPSKWTLEDQIHHLSSITIVVLLFKSIMQHICPLSKLLILYVVISPILEILAMGQWIKKPSGDLA